MKEIRINEASSRDEESISHSFCESPLKQTSIKGN